MSLALKLGSLAIRTLAKPIGNYIRRNAREHERFRKICVSFAQGLHRVDMRMRLGLLQDSAAIEKQIAKERAEAEAKRKRSEIPTVKTEAQTKAEQAAAAQEKEKWNEKAKAARKPHIRPLTEAKAIESGATFISESFLFIVAGGLIVLERWWSTRKENNRREDVADRISTLEAEIISLKAKLEGSKDDGEKEKVLRAPAPSKESQTSNQQSRS